VTHHRLLNRHVGTRRATAEGDGAGFGHNASIAATIAATSSEVAEVETSTFIEKPPRS
jgi:hypothetical protein